MILPRSHRVPVRAGLTLLEALVALVVFLVGLVPLVGGPRGRRESDATPR